MHLLTVSIALVAVATVHALPVDMEPSLIIPDHIPAQMPEAGHVHRESEHGEKLKKRFEIKGGYIYGPRGI